MSIRDKNQRLPPISAPLIFLRVCAKMPSYIFPPPLPDVEGARAVETATALDGCDQNREDAQYAKAHYLCRQSCV
jgi:hypothetical protein